MSEWREFGPELRQRRVTAGLSLGELAKKVHYSKGHLSRVESNQKPVSIELARLCDAALDAGGELVNLVRAPRSRDDGLDRTTATDVSNEKWIIGVGDDEGCFALSNDARPMAEGMTSGLGLTFYARANLDSTAALAPFLARLDGARALGQVAAPGVVLPLVLVEARMLQNAAKHAPADERVSLFQVAARFAEFAGWMAQEAGDDRIAWWLTRKAVEMADAAGDPSLRAYVLVRRADIALYQDDALSVIELASRAQQDARTPRVRALAAQREAQGHALSGDYAACLHAIERSADFLADVSAEGNTGPALGTMHAPDLVALTQGWCLHDLGMSTAAAEILETTIPKFPATAHRARLRYQIRAALAYATSGELERACDLTVSLLEKARILDSATMRHDLRSLVKVMGRRRTNRTVRDLMPALTSLMQQRNMLVVDAPANR